MRYIINQTQLHNLVYKYLDDMFEGMTPNKEINPYNSSAYEMRLGEKISYFYYGPGEYDDDTKHYGIGYLHVHPDIVDTLRQLFNIRETRVVDIVADWFSDKFEVDVDEISIYPKREKPPVY